MKLDPGVAEILEKLRKNEVPEWHTLDPELGRSVYRSRVELFIGATTNVESVEDRTIDGDGGPLALRIYSPHHSGPKPVLVYLHGGGWTLGDLDSHDELCRRLCVASESLVVSVDYRLAPENPFPAPLDDSMRAVRWVVENGAEIGADTSRIAIGGDSAGGNLTAAIALYFRDHGGPHISLQVLIYPALRAYFDTLSYHENGVGKLVSRDDCIWFWGNYLGSDARDNPYAEPMLAENLGGLPPAVIITGGLDPVRDDGEVYGHMLRAAGSQVIMKRYPRMIHGFMGLPTELPDGKHAVALVASALRSAWRGDDPVTTR